MSDQNNKYIISGPKKEIKCHPHGLGYEFYDSMQKHKDRVAQICSLTGVKDTYGDILDRCVKTAIEMRRRGITAKDTVVLSLYVHINDIVPFVATLFLNCKLACIDPSLPAEDLTELLSQMNPKMIFISTETETAMDNVLKNIDFPLQVVSFSNTGKYDSFMKFLRKTDEEEDFKPVPVTNLKDTALILFSSGTSGKPKGMCLHHYGLISQGATISDGDFKFDKEKVMAIAPIYWISSITTIIASTRLGVARVLIPKYSTKFFWEAIHTHQPSFLQISPYYILDLIKNGVPENIDASSLKIVFIGGSAVTESQMMSIRKVLPKTLVAMVYGLTEITGSATVYNVIDPKHQIAIMKKPLICGFVTANFQYKIVDPETEEIIDPRKPGELRLKTESALSGYYKMDSSDIWDKDGWLKTGDIAYIDEDNCLYIVDRIKEILKYRLFHVVPAKLEAVLLSHPDVSNAVVVGVPHHLDGDHPCAVVSVKDGSKVTADELKAYTNQKLMENEQLRGGLKIVERFPMAPSGKIKRIQVRNLVNSGHI